MFNYDGRFCHDWFNHISFLFLRVQQSVSALHERLHELKTVFFCGFFFCRYTPPDVRVRSRLSARICVCVFMRMCVKHVGVRLQTSVFVPVICVCPCISVSLCVCMNAQAQICLVKVIFFLSVRFVSSGLCVPVHMFVNLEFTGVHLHARNQSLTVNELLLQLPAAAQWRIALMSLSRTPSEGEQLDRNDCPLFTDPSLAFLPLWAPTGASWELARLLDTWILPVEAIFWANVPPPETLHNYRHSILWRAQWHFVYSAMTQTHSNMRG